MIPNIKNRLLLLLLPLVAFEFTLTAQNGTWTWMKGAPVGNPTPNFGTQGVAAASNEPPGCYEAAEWTDLAGNFWLFGGVATNPSDINSSLWRYLVATNEWTWISGAPVVNASGVYGIQGIPAPTNSPSGRGYGARTWTDLNGNLWLFGGVGADATGSFGFLNDLWMYNITSNEWTWMNGPQLANQAGNYGIQGVPAPTNLPPPTQESAATWVDNAGDLWMYGGVAGNTLIGTDDMWRYTIATNTWTWMSGQPLGPTPVNYGTLLVPATTNTPGDRFVYSHWKDQQGNFWLFGGNSPPWTTYADMWMYNPTTGLWTWMAGTNLQSPPTTFTSQCVAGGIPAGTKEDRACWTDGCGRFWSTGSDLNYLWFFDPATLQFTWVTGSLTPFAPPVLGTQNVPAPGNSPPAVLGGNGFVSANGDLWLFGGYDNSGFLPGNMNLLWRYQADPNCPSTGVLANFTLSGNGCAPDTVQFTSLSNGALNWHWDFGDTTTLADTSNLATATWIYTQSGTYTITLIVAATASCGVPDTVTQVITVDEQPLVNLGNDSLLCSLPINVVLNAGNPGMAHTWSTGATSQTITATAAGTYAVTVTNNTCSASDTFYLTLQALLELGAPALLCEHPNGVELDAGNPGAQFLWNTGATTQTITANQAGTYWVTITNGACSQSDTLEVTGIPGEAFMFVPNSFTPNGDALNDRFTGVGDGLTSFHLVIFNRWGELLFETYDPAGWDGTYQGEKAKGDVYVYLIDYTNACTQSQSLQKLGHVVLIR